MKESSLATKTKNFIKRKNINIVKVVFYCLATCIAIFFSYDFSYFMRDMLKATPMFGEGGYFSTGAMRQVLLIGMTPLTIAAHYIILQLVFFKLFPKQMKTNY